MGLDIIDVSLGQFSKIIKLFNLPADTWKKKFDFKQGSMTSRRLLLY